ncbi:uncharacterized protein B0I36DRAFT_234396 [Microdochium trichocladiopsis]|uniref:Myb-like domain-containing protein n=1 Tax=Microdochium trichocladiopsis TaxID=1682393 RepID=A0A9P9C0Y6_9PEZI|nr:uncharacterized protein B0I36DRAFT_234396 [Microdochium trichocladiopsis]KAH7041594.1 hypothetical protein B0I36DRAFT_234396 [Microdochium trichocladiopsis]
MSPSVEYGAHHSAIYTPTSDIMDRHDYGVHKQRKTASTGGGRAWSEDEEVYLLQTRLQKMPYKHIAAHLKKTELACRLHYHQLSHGSNRRRRTASVSSSSSNHSPVLAAAAPSPIMEHSPREMTPPGSSVRHASHSPDPHAYVKLPSIMGRPEPSSQLPAILPKPAAMGLSPEASHSAYHHRMPTPGPDMSKPLEPSAFSRPSSSLSHPETHSNLRLDCSSLPQPAPYVDLGRLSAVYGAHRASFWGAVAADYGSGMSPAVLEQAWKSSLAKPATFAPFGHGLPMTPATSPSERESSVDRQGQDRTRISAILGINANPRSFQEREMVRRLEEGQTGAIMTPTHA